MNPALKKLLAAIAGFLARRWAEAQALRRGWSKDAARLAAIAAGIAASLIVTAAL
jgi:hypothetical protein